MRRYLQWRPFEWDLGMDFLYLLLLVLLIAGTAGFLRLCARLEREQ